METINSLSQAALYPLILAALRDWHNTSQTLLYKPLTQLSVVQQAYYQSTPPRSWQVAVQQVLLAGLDKLAETNEEGVHIIQQRYIAKQMTNKIALDLNTSPDTVNRRQRKAIEQLAKMMAYQETAQRDTTAQKMEDGLPKATYTRLFGQDEAIEKLVQIVIKPEPPWLLAVSGMGGIGKTAVVDKVVRTAIRRYHFDGLIWLRVETPTMSERNLTPDLVQQQIESALAQQLPTIPSGLIPSQQRAQIRQRLKAQSYLIVIDNIEQPSVLSHLITAVGDWGHSGKCLLTTRVRLPGPQMIFTQSIGELSEENSLQLLRYEAGQLGLEEITAAEDGRLQPIYQVVGGNPFALKLIVGLAATMPLDVILTDLVQNRPGPAEKMYKHIYQKTWQSLSEAAQILLEVMPLVSKTGAQPEQMQAASELDETQFWAAVQELVSRSLLETRGTAWDRRYGIHHLTETFLHTDVINWPPGKQ